MFDFNKLKTFIAVADHQSVTRAASSLHLTQQAVSHQIAMLETDLGLSLFVRANRRIHLTPEGHQVLTAARNQLEPLEEALLSIKSGVQALRGRIVIGCLPETARQFVLPHVAHFREQHNEVQFEFKLDTDRATEQRLFSGEVDLGYVIFKSAANHLEAKPFVEVPYVAVAAPDLIERYGPFTRIEQLVEVPFVDYLPSGPGFLTWIKKNSRHAYNKMLHRVAEVSAPDEQVMRQLVLNGIGVGVVPRYLADEDIADGKLHPILARSKKATARFEAITLKNRQLPAAVQKFFDVSSN